MRSNIFSSNDLPINTIAITKCVVLALSKFKMSDKNIEIKHRANTFDYSDSSASAASILLIQ